MRLISIILVLIIGAATTASAQVTDVIRGRVTGPDSMPLQGVNVRATSYIGGVAKTTTTDKNGRFTIVFINGEGDYWLDYVKLGFAPRRFEVKKIGDEDEEIKVFSKEEALKLPDLFPNHAAIVARILK